MVALRVGGAAGWWTHGVGGTTGLVVPQGWWYHGNCGTKWFVHGVYGTAGLMTRGRWCRELGGTLESVVPQGWWNHKSRWYHRVGCSLGWWYHWVCGATRLDGTTVLEPWGGWCHGVGGTTGGASELLAARVGDTTWLVVPWCWWHCGLVVPLAGGPTESAEPRDWWYLRVGGTTGIVVPSGLSTGFMAPQD